MYFNTEENSNFALTILLIRITVIRTRRLKAVCGSLLRPATGERLITVTIHWVTFLYLPGL